MKFIKLVLPLILIGICANASADTKNSPELLSGVMDSVEYLNNEQKIAARGSFYVTSWRGFAHSQAKSHCSGKNNCWVVVTGLATAMTIEKKDSNASQDYTFRSY